MTKEVTDATHVWVYGKAEPGWYCAKLVWDQAYAAHLQSLDYRVVRSIGRPTIDGRPTDFSGRPVLEAV